MTKLIIRLGYGLLFAIPLMLISYALAYAASDGQASSTVSQQQGQQQECAACHPAVTEAWQGGRHSQAMTDPVFNQAWEAQGKPVECLKCHVTGYDETSGSWQSEGITCLACHPALTANHPAQVGEVNASPDLCGDCHTDTYFEWQVSMHGQKGLKCVNCHDPHATSLKRETSSTLCAACHKGLSSSFTHSQHNAQGLVCIDCHMEPVGDAVGHTRQDHSFFVSLDTCNTCHSNQLHNPGLTQPVKAQVNPVDAMASVEDVSVSGVPRPVSPLGFAILAGLVGIALGINIAPVLERWNRRRGEK
jgi:predicted CXXCH cytochrome family protein